MFSRFSNWFKRTPEPSVTPNAAPLVGQAVHVTANPTRAAARNAGRVERLRLAIAQTHNEKKKAEFAAELAQREKRS